MPPSASHLDFLKDLFSPFGAITIRKMFGGAGIYCDGRIFAICDDEDVWLKVDEVTRAEFEEAGLKPFEVEMNGKKGTMSYYKPPDDIYDDNDVLTSLVRTGRLARRNARRSQKRKPKKRRRQRSGPKRRRRLLPEVPAAAGFHRQRSYARRVSPHKDIHSAPLDKRFHCIAMLIKTDPHGHGDRAKIFTTATFLEASGIRRPRECGPPACARSLDLFRGE